MSNEERMMEQLRLLKEIVVLREQTIMELRVENTRLEKQVMDLQDLIEELDI